MQDVGGVEGAGCYRTSSSILHLSTTPTDTLTVCLWFHPLQRPSSQQVVLCQLSCFCYCRWLSLVHPHPNIFWQRPHECKQSGHISRDCLRRRGTGTEKGEGVGNPQRFSRSEVKCFSCGQKGHIGLRCPAKALFCRSPQRKGSGLAESCGG